MVSKKLFGILLIPAASSFNYVEWHCPYLCGHHGFVTELLSYLPALERSLAPRRVIVTGLGPCSAETLEEFGPEPTEALRRALLPSGAGKAGQVRRHCRLSMLENGEWGQLCDRGDAHDDDDDDDDDDGDGDGCGDGDAD